MPRYNALRMQKSGLWYLTVAWLCTPLHHCPRLPCTISHKAMRRQSYSARSMACHACCRTAQRERGLLALAVQLRGQARETGYAAVLMQVLHVLLRLQPLSSARSMGCHSI